MTQWIDAAEVTFERTDLARRIVSQVAPGAVAVGLAAALGAWLLYIRPAEVAKAPSLVGAVKTQMQVFGALSPPVPAPSPAASRNSGPYGDLVVAGFEPEPRFTLAEREPEPDVPAPPVPAARMQTEEAAPLPPHRPAEFAMPRAPEAAPRMAELEPDARPPVRPARPDKPPAADERSVIEKLFGLPHAGQTPSPAARAAQPALAYAAPETSVARSPAAPAGRGGLFDFLRGPGLGSSSPTARYGGGVAVYDISAHVVYLPDGTKLEAHSGLGDRLDDPRSVAERMRGATPPATYSLTPREALFHGVPALRLTPIEGNVFGRAGLLAHTYMLGPNGDSNGCISFRDYEAFLRAYQNGQVRKLVVVANL